MHLSFPRVGLFISLVISCSGKPTPFLQLADRSSNVTSSLSSLERRAGVTELLTECGSASLATITIGDLDKEFHLLIDTGSCWTWIKKDALKNHSLGVAGQPFKARYTVGYAKGMQYTSKITIGGSLVIEDQIIGVADEYDDEAREDVWHGILGLGICTNHRKYPPEANVFQNLRKTHIPGSLGVLFTPVREKDCGQLTWGGYDRSCCAQGLSIVPIKPVPDDSALEWVVDASISYQNTTLQSDSEDTVAVHLDTGGTTIRLTEEAYDKFLDATGAEPYGRLTKISVENYHSMVDLNIVMGGLNFPLSPNALKSWYGSRHNDTDSSVSESGASDTGTSENGSGTADEFIVLRVSKSKKSKFFVLGYPFFERYYIHLDADNRQVGIGITEYTNSLKN